MIREEERHYELNENYKNLMYAVLYKACEDYSAVLRRHKRDKDINPHNSTVYKFLMDPDNPYALYLDISMPKFVHQMEKNFQKYGKACLRPDDWAKIKRGEELMNKYGEE